MAHLQDARLGTLELDADHFGETTLELDGRVVDVGVEVSRPAQLLAGAVLDLLGLEPRVLLERAAAGVASDRSGAVEAYLDRHLADLDEGELTALLGEGAPRDAASLRAALRPLAVHAPDPTSEDEEPLVVEFGLGQDVSAQVLAVILDRAGQVLGVELED